MHCLKFVKEQNLTLFNLKLFLYNIFLSIYLSVKSKKTSGYPVSNLTGYPVSGKISIQCIPN
jgi:hypothetical protein